MANYLITGGAGFIGTNFCLYMVEKYQNDRFICYDALTYASNFKGIKLLKNNLNFKFIYGNICDKKKVEKVLEKEKIDVIINFAAETHVDRSLMDAKPFIKTNVEGTQILLDCAKKFNIKRFHQVSTDEVYGDLNLEDDSFVETSNLYPSNPYSASKAAADLLVLAYYRTYGLPCTISRCCNTYGPYQHQEKLIPMVIKKGLSNQQIPVYGTGKNIRDWIYVLDHCTAIDAIVRKGKPGEIYNVSGKCEYSNIEIIETILNQLKKPKDLIYYVNDRLGHDFRYSMDLNKISKELKWEAKTSLLDGLAKTIKWYQED